MRQDIEKMDYALRYILSLFLFSVLMVVILILQLYYFVHFLLYCGWY